MIDEIVLLHRPELSQLSGTSGDRITLHRNGPDYSLSINRYDGLLIGLTDADLLQIAIALLNALRLKLKE